jgi:hypothetical protein
MDINNYTKDYYLKLRLYTNHNLILFIIPIYFIIFLVVAKFSNSKFPILFVE